MADLEDPRRAAWREAADYLEGRTFRATKMAGATDEEARQAAAAWTAGYRRAIHELRSAVMDPVVIPDDLSELDTT